jgi:hypothetical protein
LIGNGWIVTALVLLPNLFYVLFPPAGKMGKAPEKPRRLDFVMTALERIGQASCFLLPFFGSFHFGGKIAPAALIFGAFCLFVYYVCWTRYFLGGRRIRLLYAPLFFIPLPMAVFPILLFATSGFFLGQSFLFASSAVLAAGHLYNSEKERRRNH